MNTPLMVFLWTLLLIGWVWLLAGAWYLWNEWKGNALARLFHVLLCALMITAYVSVTVMLIQL